MCRFKLQRVLSLCREDNKRYEPFGLRETESDEAYKMTQQFSMIPPKRFDIFFPPDLGDAQKV